MSFVEYKLKSAMSAFSQNVTASISRASPRLWHGTTDTTRGWVPAGSQGFRPNARAFAVDYERVIPTGVRSALVTGAAAKR